MIYSLFHSLSEKNHHGSLNISNFNGTRQPLILIGSEARGVHSLARGLCPYGALTNPMRVSRALNSSTILLFSQILRTYEIICDFYHGQRKPRRQSIGRFGSIDPTISRRCLPRNQGPTAMDPSINKSVAFLSSRFRFASSPDS